MNDAVLLRTLEEWTGHRRPPSSKPPPRPMKTAFLLLLAIMIGLTVLGLSACATVESVTTVTAPDGTVTVTTTKTTAPDAGSVAALSVTAQAFAPRAVIVHPSK